MKLFFATENEHKVKELKDLVASMDIEVVCAKDYPLFVSPEETGSTFKENARIKAESALAFTGLPSLADDSGLVVAALGGAPGVYSARYGGNHATAKENNEKLLREMANIPAESRDAYFCAVLCLAMPDGRVFFGEGRIYGMIMQEYRGSDGFGYDPLFFATEVQKGMAELTLKEKNKISHRSRAFNDIFKALRSVYSKNA